MHEIFAKRRQTEGDFAAGGGSCNGLWRGDPEKEEGTPTLNPWDCGHHSVGRRRLLPEKRTLALPHCVQQITHKNAHAKGEMYVTHWYGPSSSGEIFPWATFWCCSLVRAVMTGFCLALRPLFLFPTTFHSKERWRESKRPRAL